MRTKRPTALGAGLAGRNQQLARENAILEAIGMAALAVAYRHAASLAKMGAMARAIARGDVPEADRTALAATLRQLAEQGEGETQQYIATLRDALACRRSGAAGDDSPFDAFTAH